MRSTAAGRAARASRVTRVVVGRAHATIPAGATQHVTVKFTRAGIKLLQGRHRHIESKLTITGTAGTNTIHESRTIGVKLRK